MAYWQRAWIGPGIMASMILCKTFHTAPGMGPGQGPMVYQTIFAPFLVPMKVHCLVISACPITQSWSHAHYQSFNFSVILFPASFPFPVQFKLCLNKPLRWHIALLHILFTILQIDHPLYIGRLAVCYWFRHEQMFTVLFCRITLNRRCCTWCEGCWTY